MKALCIVYENIDDWEAFDRYRSQVMRTLEPFGARFLVRGGAFTTVEGEMPFERIAVLEFPSLEAAQTWYHSDAYQEVLQIRLAAADVSSSSSTPLKPPDSRRIGGSLTCRGGEGLTGDESRGGVVH